jgi:hypothetical protein
MRYLGQAGLGAGAIYIGKGKIVGIDAANGRYQGSYTEQNGRIKATVALSIPGGGQLVTGQQLPAGQQLQITGDWPANFANGQPQQVSVAGHTVSVTFEKIGDVP